MDIDQWLSENRYFGNVFKRQYSFFRKHQALTDFAHISIGLSVGLLIGKYYVPALLFLSLGISYHVYAIIITKDE